MFRELFVPAAVGVAFVSILLPLPPVFLDFLLVANLLLALSLLVTSLYLSEPLKLSALPTMLLLATLFRLSLNISTTRLILGSGTPSRVIEAFGSGVIQGNLLVGAVIFLVITLVQFIVIAKGAERVAEVAARFTLDALPGKQMSIDADVRAGLIDFTTARDKRQELQIESRFYGALDGAMKFIKGDAIAGIAITAINIVGGLVVGVFMYEMALPRAVSQYTILTVGDGLLSQIPALLNALAAGLVVTRVARGDDAPLVHEVLGQLGQLRRVRAVMGGLCFFLVFIPGMPIAPFVIFGAALLMSLLFKEDEQQKDEGTVERFEPHRPPPIAIECGRELGRKLVTEHALEQKLEDARKSIYEEKGLILLPFALHLHPNENAFRVVARGVPAGKAVELDGSEEDARRVVEIVKETISGHALELIDDTMTRRLLDEVEAENPEFVAGIIPSIVSVTQVTSLLRELIAEGVSIRNFDVLLQAVAEKAPAAPGERALLEEVRLALRRSVVAGKAPGGEALRVITLDPVIDITLFQAERHNEPAAPECLTAVAEALKNSTLEGDEVLLVSRGARHMLKDALEAQGLLWPVLAHEEVNGIVSLQEVAHIELPSNEEREEMLEALAA